MKTWTAVGLSLMGGTILTTYAFFVAHGGEVFLPTISNTWEAPPGNYISRFFGGYAMMMLYGFCVANYWWREAGQRERGVSFMIGNGVLLAMSVFGVFCLSWVPPICDTKDPDCRGNNNIHTTFAVTFFALYDVFMIIETCQTSHLLSVCDSWVKLLLVVGSVASKARFLFTAPADVSASSFPALAVFEWSDVACIIAWTWHSASLHAGPYSIAISRPAAPDAAASKIARGPVVRTRGLRAGAIGLSVLTLAASLAAGIANGTLPSGRIPYISDMWVYPPGNWFSRWGVVTGVAMAVISQLMLYLAGASLQGGTTGPDAAELSPLHGGRGTASYAPVEPAGAPQGVGLAMTALATIALVGLAVVGCVDESENITVHTTAAAVFFAGYDAYMVIGAVGALMARCGLVASGGYGAMRGVGAWLWMLPAVSIVSKARFLSAAPGWGPSVGPILEWSDTFVIIVYMWIDVASRPTVQSIQFSLLESAPSAPGGRYTQDDATRALADYAAILDSYERDERKRAGGYVPAG